jgi:hypothetical protein
MAPRSKPKRRRKKEPAGRAQRATRRIQKRKAVLSAGAKHIGVKDGDAAFTLSYLSEICQLLQLCGAGPLAVVETCRFGITADELRRRLAQPRLSEMLADCGRQTEQVMQ